ncbi:MAG: hypothetical protein AAB367_04150 [Patescibacteria group bacterium]
MKKIAVLAMAGLFLSPALAFAHEHHVYKIGNNLYEFTVGSLAEPIAVDDKTGVELRVKKLGAAPAHEDDHGAAAGHDEEGAPVTGLEQTLKVELTAGGKSKELALTPAYNDPGAYRAVFVPTVMTTYTYRFKGTIDGVAVDLSFTCNPAGHPRAEDDNTMIKMTDAVARMSKGGAFGCPMAKADLGFPEPSADVVGIGARIDRAEQYAGKAKTVGAVGILIGLIGVGIAGFALSKAKKVV